MKKIIAMIMTAVLVSGLSACGGEATKTQTTAQQEAQSAPAAGSVKRITFGTAGTSGALYPMGVAMSQMITDHVDGIASTGEATAASIENLRNLHQGAMELAISQTEVASFAYKGQSDYEGNAFTDIRALFSAIDNYLQVVVLADSEIQSISDLSGKKVSMGAAGSGGELAARTALLPSYGLDYDSITPQFMGDADGASALKDKKIDALIVTNPINSATLTELTTSAEVRLLPIESDEFYQAYPAYVPYTVPAGTYNGIDKDIVIPRSRIIVCTSTNAGMSDEEVYEIVKAIWDNRSEWEVCHKAVSGQATLENVLIGIDIPMHPGAIRYFEEIGAEIPDNLKE